MSNSDNPRHRRRKTSIGPSGRRNPDRQASRSEARTPDRQASRSEARTPDRQTSRSEARTADRQTSRSEAHTPDRQTSRSEARNCAASPSSRPAGRDRRTGEDQPRRNPRRDSGSTDGAFRDSGRRDSGIYNSRGGGRSREYRNSSAYASRASRRSESAGQIPGERQISRRNESAATSRRRHTRRPGRRLQRRHLLPVLLLPTLVLTAVLFSANHMLFREPVQQTAPITEPTEVEPPLFSSVSVIPEELRNLIQENPAVSEVSEVSGNEEEANEGVMDWDAAFPDGPDPEMEDLTQEDGQKTRKPHFFTFLLAGTDDNHGGSDTMILVGMDTKEKRITGVSLPRDTKCYVNDQPRKLNFAYRSGGMKRLAKTVSWQLGIPIDYTVEVDLQGFVALVDAIGGVDFNVPINMDYDDEAQNLYIGFEKGMQHLDGKDALKVVRFRHNWDGTGYGDEDLGRMRTQQEFLKTVAKKILTPGNIKKVGKFVEIFQQYVKTDLTAGNMAWLGRAAISIGADGVEFSTLPGNWKSPYIYPDRDKVLNLLNENLNPYESPITSKDLHIAR